LAALRAGLETLMAVAAAWLPNSRGFGASIGALEGARDTRETREPLDMSFQAVVHSALTGNL
jgi:hypothetical protein